MAVRAQDELAAPDSTTRARRAAMYVLREGHDLQVFWFIAIAVLWTGFFVLEGFDFGVGILRGVVGKTDASGGSPSTRSGRSGTGTRSG